MPRTVPKLMVDRRYLITFPDSKLPSKIGTFIYSLNGIDYFNVNEAKEAFVNDPESLYPNDEQYYLLDVPSLQELASERIPNTPENVDLLKRMGIIKGGKHTKRRKRRTKGPTRVRTGITRFKVLCANHYTIRPSVHDRG